MSELSESQREYYAIIRCAQLGLARAGFRIDREVGDKRSPKWLVSREGQKPVVCAVKSTRDGWFAFARGNGKWKTLDDVDDVIVGALVEGSTERAVSVFYFPGSVAREHFEAAFEARKAAGQQVYGSGMWISLDKKDGVNGAGSGLAHKYQPVAKVQLIEGYVNRGGSTIIEGTFLEPEAPAGPQSVADVLAETRRKVAALLRVAEADVRIELHVEG